MLADDAPAVPGVRMHQDVAPTALPRDLNPESFRVVQERREHINQKGFEVHGGSRETVAAGPGPGFREPGNG